MTEKVNLNDLASLENEASAVYTINQNNTKIEQAFQDSLSRTGKTPNVMEATFDMNGNRILNLPKPLNPSEPLRLFELNNFTEDLDQRVLNAQIAADAAEVSRTGAVAAAGVAEGWATASEDSAADSANSATASQGFSTTAEGHAAWAWTQSQAAEASATKANNWANTPLNTTVPGEAPGTYSAKHWAAQAQAVAGGVTATGTAFTPAGNIAASNVQAAIQELDTEKASIGSVAVKFDTTGGTFTGKITTIAGGTSAAPLNVPHGAAPTTPVNGDIWSTTGGVFAHINGTTRTLATTDNLSAYATLGSAAFTGNISTTGGLTAAGDIVSSTVLRAPSVSLSGPTVYLSNGSYYYHWNGTHYANHRGTIWDSAIFDPATKLNAYSPNSSGSFIHSGAFTLNVGSDITMLNGTAVMQRYAGPAMYVDRYSNTGQVISFRYNSSNSVGSISISGSSTNFNTTSDERLKDNIMPSFPVGDIIDDIEVVDYTWKETGESDKGVIAQQVIDVYPLVVLEPETDEDFYQVDYSRFVPLLLKEVQDLRKRVQELESK